MRTHLSAVLVPGPQMDQSRKHRDDESTTHTVLFNKRNVLHPGKEKHAVKRCIVLCNYVWWQLHGTLFNGQECLLYLEELLGEDVTN